MTNIVFASNNIAHFPLSESGSVADTFDATRVPYAISLTGYDTIHGPEFTPVTGDDTWFHFRFYADDIDTSLGTSLISGYLDDGELLFDIRKKTSSSSMRATVKVDNGSTDVSVDTTNSWTLYKVNTCDVKVTVTSLLIEVSLYINSALSATATLNSNPNARTAPVRFSLSDAMNDVSTAVTHFSEIIVADGDTRNARLDLLRPVSTGAHEEWTGNLADIADDDPTSGLTAITGGLRQTAGLSTYTGASNISNFIITSQTTRGQNSPTGLQHMVRLGGVDYTSSTIPVDFTLQYNLTDYALNPATSLPWVGADVAVIETGFKSIT